MGRRGVMASTPSEMSELSPQELDNQIAYARFRISMISKASLRKMAEKRLRMLEAIREEKTRHPKLPLRPIIPTTDRAKLWNSTGYPLGAQAISEALYDVPQYDQLELRFYEFDSWSERAGRPIRVLRADFFSRRGGIFGHQARPRGWNITLRAVPRSLKNPIKTALVENGLSHLRQWFLDVGPLDECDEGTASIEFCFNDENALVIKVEKRLFPERS